MSDQLILTSLVASVDSQSPPSDADGRRSHSASEKSSVKESCKSIGQACQSSTTSTTSTAESTEASRYSPGDFRASLGVKPGSDLARMMTAHFGRRCSALLWKRDRVSSWLKTLLESSTWNSTTCFLRWRAQTTPSGRALFRLAPSMQDTNDHESGFSEPTTWFPTPTTQDAHNNGAPSQHQRKTKPLNAEVNGALNPMFVEWLMGYPIGWTDCADSATRSCRKSLKKS